MHIQYIEDMKKSLGLTYHLIFYAIYPEKVPDGSFSQVFVLFRRQGFKIFLWMSLFSTSLILAKIL